jgi:cytochrome c553
LAAVFAALLTMQPAFAAEPPAVAQSLCASCHGADGNSAVATFPRLAGLQPQYIEKQLEDYLSGRRKSEVMAPLMATFNRAEVPALAAWYAAQKPAPGTPGDAKLMQAGRVLYDDGNTTTGVPSCSGCHQDNAVGNERYPRLAGQHAVYTREQMQQFKKGARSNDKVRVMRVVAERMSEAEIAAVAEYLAGL